MRTSVATTRTWAIQLVLCSFALSACGTDAEDPQTTTETTTETSELSDGSQVLCQTCAPHESAVKLVKSGTTFCSGSVISSNRVLTSAKCLKANAFTPTNLCITNRIQSTSCGGASEMYNVSRGFVHPSFIGTSSGSDAAVLEVDHPLRPFGNASGTIPALPIDTGIFGNDFQGDDFGFGTNPQIPSLTGQKQVRSGVPSVATSQPRYIGFGTLTVLTGDFGGGLISGFNSLAGINSFVQNGKSFMTRTQPIRNWIASPDIVVGSTPACFLGGQFFVSVHNGMCLQAASSGSGVSLEFCNCTALQRWNRLQGTQGLVFQNVQRNMCLTAPGPTPSVGISSCFTGDRFQNWFLFNTNTQAQLTSASGPTLLTQDTNVVTAGGSNSFNRWWNIQPKQAALTPIQISADPFTTTDSQHATQVEPDSYSFGSTIVAASQTGRFANGGGATGIAFATSTDSGVHWTTDVLPALTTANGGTLDRVTDPSVAFDARHNVWMVVTLGIRTTDAAGSQVRVSRSTNGGLTWSNPVTVAMAPSPFGFDKTWVACDNVSTSPFYGNCYAEWDDSAFGGIIEMSTSTDGGVTWGTPRSPADNASGVGGQPVVLPNGTVVVPIADSTFSNLLAFRSTNGGASWSATTFITGMPAHDVAGALRSEPLPSAEVDAAGRVYVAWPDCRFRANCSSNDIVMTTSTDGLAWTAVTRIPIDAVTSTVDHFIPGLGVDRTTSGSTARLGLTYYFYPDTNCTASTCQLSVGFVSSRNGGSTWSAPITLAGPMALNGLATVGTSGKMVGDYISTSFAGGTAHPVYIASSPIDLGDGFIQLNQAMYAATVTP